MAASNYFENTLKSRVLLKETIAFMGTHYLRADPISYTVCYEYLKGDHLSLKHSIDQTLSAKIPLTSQMMTEWFNNFLYGYIEEKLKQSHADLINVVSNLKESAMQAEDHVTQFDEALRVSEKELSNKDRSIDSIVENLLGNTRLMQNSMELMKQQIQKSNQEINSLQERLKRATEEALTDPLTGLTNRKRLANAIEVAVLSTEESQSYPCLLMMDIDHFKKINDSFGHPVGDKAIKTVAQTLKSQIKGKDTPARYGGEEFCVLLPETELSDAVKVAETIRCVIEKSRIRRVSDNQELCLMTISIGVARYKPHESIIELFERADKALYKPKDGGRNRVTFLTE